MSDEGARFAVALGCLVVGGVTAGVGTVLVATFFGMVVGLPLVGLGMLVIFDGTTAIRDEAAHHFMLPWIAVAVVALAVAAMIGLGGVADGWVILAAIPLAVYGALGVAAARVNR